MWLPSHFIIIPLSYFIIVCLATLSKRLPPSEQLRILRVLFFLALLSELLKHLIALITQTYSPAYYPVHYSTTYYISLGLIAFGNSETRHYGACTLFVGGTYLLLTTTFHPGAVVGNTALVLQSYFRFHSFFYHMLVLLAYAVMLANHHYRPQRRDLWRYTTFLLTWGAVAVSASYLTGVNYAGILHSYIPLLEELRLQAGNAVYLLTYAGLAILAGSLLLRLYGQAQIKKAP